MTNYKDFADGQGFFGSDADLLMKAGTPRFDTTTQRDSFFSSVGLDTGQTAYVTGIGAQLYNGSVWVTTVPSDLSTAWTAPTLNSNWVAYDSTEGTYSTLRYRKLSSGLVLLRGLIKTTVTPVPTNSTIATLPAGFRPGPAQMIYGVYRSDASISRVNIANTGVITTGVAISLAVGSYLSFDGFNFLAEN